MRRFVSFFVLAAALSLIATVSSGSGARPAMTGQGTFGNSRFTLSPASYTWRRTDGGAFITGNVECSFDGGSYGSVGGTITAATGIVGPAVGTHFNVYFSGQTTTGPDIDSQTPGCPPVSAFPYHLITKGGINY